jgi:hypothetical protein
MYSVPHAGRPGRPLRSTTRIVRLCRLIVWHFVILAPNSLEAGQQVAPPYRAAHFGHALMCTLDLNGDGVRDIIVTAPGGSGYNIFAFSGKNQGILWRAKAESPGDRMGWSLCSIGDVNRDGTSDLAVSSPGFRGTFEQAVGRVSLLSGKDGARLRPPIQGESGSVLGELLGSTGDVDGDGTLDLAVSGGLKSESGTWIHGQLLVYSGNTMKLLRSLNGAQVARGFRFDSALCVSDCDGGGRRDLAAGSPRANSTGTVGVFSLESGRVLTRLSGALVGDSFGWSLAGGDPGRAKSGSHYLIGSPDARGVDGRSCGLVASVDAKTGVKEYQVDGLTPGERFGSAMCWTLDGRSQSFLVVGAPGYSDSTGRNRGRLHVIADNGTTRVFTVLGTTAESEFGAIVASAGDLDADGAEDIVVGAPTEDGNPETDEVEMGKVHVVSAARRTITVTLTPNGAHALGDSSRGK